jgi:hypothetical protein
MKAMATGRPLAYDGVVPVGYVGQSYAHTVPSTSHVAPPPIIAAAPRPVANGPPSSDQTDVDQTADGMRHNGRERVSVASALFCYGRAVKSPDEALRRCASCPFLPPGCRCAGGVGGRSCPGAGAGAAAAADGW